MRSLVLSLAMRVGVDIKKDLEGILGFTEKENSRGC